MSSLALKGVIVAFKHAVGLMPVTYTCHALLTLSCFKSSVAATVIVASLRPSCIVAKLLYSSSIHFDLVPLTYISCSNGLL